MSSKKKSFQQNLHRDIQANALGKVYLVGAGPGAVDLITVRGAKLLAIADIVFYDALVDPAMLELCPKAEKIAVGKRCGKLSSAQQFINKRLVDAAQKYQTIVRLKGGDPMLFGRADEEIITLKQAGIAVEVVPGITAALAGAASLQQSLTLRGVSRSVAFATLAQGTENSTVTTEDIVPITNPTADTMVYYMGRKDAANIAKQLIGARANHTSETPVHILEAVSTPKERLWTSTLGKLAHGLAEDWFDTSSPALIFIGKAFSQIDAEAKDSNQGTSAKIDDGLQDSQILTNGRRRA
jgi:uroporphyrin-III C-methyltransferase